MNTLRTKKALSLRRAASALSFTAALLVATSASAQTAPLPTITQFAAPYVDIQNIPGITGLTTTNCSGSDDCLTTTINLPFSFTFIGQTKTALKISSNGWITFNTNEFGNFLGNVAIPNPANPNDIIAFNWDDLVSNVMRYGVFGAAPNRVFVIESTYRRFGGSGNGKNQIWLYESDSSFELRYDGGSTLTGFFTSTFGIENATGTQGVDFRPNNCTAPNCGLADIVSLDGQVLRAGPLDDPELSIEVGAFPRGGFPGTTGTGTVTARNIGLNAATNVLIDVWLSANDQLEPAIDFRIATATAASLPNGATDVLVNWSVPSNLPNGDYFVIARVDANDQYVEINEADNVAVGAQRFATAYELSGNDCRVVNPRGANPGDPITFELDLVNNGVPYVGAVDIQLRASTDAAFDATDPTLGTASMIFQGGNRETGQSTFTLPAGAIPPGLYYPICIIDPANTIPETNRANNIVVGANRFGSGPDFTVSSVVLPSQVLPGGAVDITTTIQNLAVPFTGRVEYRLYASRTPTLDRMTAVVLGNWAVDFSGQDAVPDTRSVTFPASLPGARYRVIAEVDPSNRIPEVDAMNNVRSSATDIVNAFDFVTATASRQAMTSAQAGTPIRVQATFRSEGIGLVGHVPVGVYYSVDGTFDGTDFEAYRGLVFFNGTNATASLDVTFPTPAVTPGNYTLVVVVNPDNDSREADFSNNVRAAGGALTIQGADLRADVLTAPEIVFIGRPMEVSLEILNDSSVASANGFRYALFFSEDENISVISDQQIFLSPPISIPAGGRRSFTDQVTVPTFTSTRSLYLGVVVDIFSAVPEVNISNNRRRIPNPLSVVFPIPDLTGQIVETGTAAAAGEQLAVTRLIANIGVEDAPSFDYTYYLSSNASVSPSDIAVGTFTTGLATNQDDYGIDILDIPPNVTPGTYFLGMILDPQNRVTEITKDNNNITGPQIPVFGAAIRFITSRLDNGTLGVPYQVGVYAQGGSEPITWSVSAGDLPGGLSLDGPGGIISGTPSSEGRFEFTLRASSGTAFAERSFAVRITSPSVQLAVATPNLRAAVVGRTYRAQVIAVGGVPPYRWSALGTLPPGLSFSEDGTVEGTPLTPGSFMVTVRVTDDIGGAATSQVALNVLSPAATVRIQQVPLPDAIVGRPYCVGMQRVELSAQNGVEPYVWSSIGDLPEGMSFGEDGALCGTPTSAGEYNLSFRVQDATGISDTALFRLTVQGSDECAVATVTLPRGQVNAPYVQGEDARAIRIQPVNCAEPLTVSTIEGAGRLPPGITLAADGTLSGTPTAAGAYAFLAQVTDSTGTVDIQPLSIVVDPVPEIPLPLDDGCTCAAPREARRPWLALLPALAFMVFRRRR